MREKSTIEASQNTTEKMVTAGQILRAYREKSGMNLKDISAATKIPLHHLQAIELDDYGDYNNQVFVRGFVKNYAAYLGLDQEKVLAIYRRTAATLLKTKPDRAKGKKTQGKPWYKSNPRELLGKIEITPTRVIVIFSAFLILFLAIYLATQFYKFQAPPQLSVATPENNITVDKDQLDITGKTDLNAIVKVNENLINTDTSGNFTTSVKLVAGINTIIIKAYKNTNEQRANLITRNITYTPPAQPTTPVTPVAPTTYKVKITVTKEPAWIMLILDNKQILAQIVKVGTTQEYTFTKTLQTSTGKPASTKVFINGTDTPYVINHTIGSANLNCQVTNNNLSCDKQ